MSRRTDRTNNFSRLAEQALALAAKGSAREVRITDIAERANLVSTRSLKIASMLLETLRVQSEVLTGEQLEKAAALFPAWSVSAGFKDGKARKTFSRKTGDFREEVVNSTSMLGFTKAGHFDVALLDIFDSEEASGGPEGFTIVADEAGPVTQQDIGRILEAEAYLGETGCIDFEAQTRGLRVGFVLSGYEHVTDADMTRVYSANPHPDNQ